MLLPSLILNVVNEIHHNFKEAYLMSNENKAMVLRTMEALWNEGNLAVADERFASDYVGHAPGKIEGPEGVKQFVSAMRNAAPEIHIEDQIAEGDKVVTRWTAGGRHEGEFQGIPPTGNQVSITGITIFRIANGKIIEGWTNADRLGLMQQLGAVPAPGQAR
jgi:steroid delta-isomerase-like uncharacterized protein